LRIVTLDSVAGVGIRDGYIYEGGCYLVRFGIESPDHFFLTQLPWMVATLRIDVRQILRLELLSDGQSGLRQAIVCVSLEDSEAGARRLGQKLENLFSAPPASWRAESTDRREIVRKHLIDFLLSAPSSRKAQFLKSSRLALRGNAVWESHDKYTDNAAGLVCRISYEAGPPNIAEWRNILLHCSETLRHAFQPQDIHCLDLRAIPNSEKNYLADVELLFPSLPVLHRVRSQLRYAFERKRTKPSKGIEIEIGLPEDRLNPTEQIVLSKFDALDTLSRLYVWNKHLARFFR